MVFLTLLVLIIFVSMLAVIEVRNADSASGEEISGFDIEIEESSQE